MPDCLRRTHGLGSGRKEAAASKLTQAQLEMRNSETPRNKVASLSPLCTRATYGARVHFEEWVDGQWPTQGNIHRGEIAGDSISLRLPSPIAISGRTPGAHWNCRGP